MENKSEQMEIKSEQVEIKSEQIENKSEQLECKGSTHTTMTDSVRIALCQYKKDHPRASHKELMLWLEKNYMIEVSQATISRTLKKSTEHLAKSDNTNLNVKRLRSVRYPAMESALVEWLHANQERVNLSNKLILESAAKILDFLYPDHEPFKFSNGWLEAFKARHNIRSFRRFGERSSVDMVTVADIHPNIQQLLGQYEWKDIYIMDETGLFYRMQADNSLATKQLEGQKRNKERITLSICCNGDGSDKLQLWVIGKYKNPRCFKHINMDTLGCQYRNNTKALMTQAIFLEWLKAFDQHVSGRNVLLMLDNCSAHIPIEQLPDQIHLLNTKVFYLPPNMTSKIKPCNAGIIQNFKAYYHRRFNHMLLQRLEDNVKDPVKIDILAGITLAVIAWNSDVNSTVIANCFHHSKIRMTDDAVVDVREDELVDPNVIQDIQSQICQFKYNDPMDVQHLLNYPDEEVVCGTPNLDEIIQNHIPVQVPAQDAYQDEADDSEEVPPVHPADAFKSIEIIERFWMQQTDYDTSFITALQKMRDRVSEIIMTQIHQKNIESLFQHL